MTVSFTRRRFISISAAFGGSALFPLHSLAQGLESEIYGEQIHYWTGRALGAQAYITLSYDNKEAAKSIFAECSLEMIRLEEIFSLYNPSSSISLLNQNGVLKNPPPELVELIHASRSFSAASGGAFDISIQPLWLLYSTHFSSEGTHVPPAGALIKETLKRVDYRQIDVQPMQVRFLREGMSITLNGIAQGYITDRVASILQKHGATDVLIDIGEHRALGQHPAGRPWQLSIPRPGHEKSYIVPLTHQALSTSAGYGTLFDKSGTYHHLLNATSGQSARQHSSVSVFAPTATLADGLSTTLSLLPTDKGMALLKQYEHTAALFQHADGTVTTHNIGTKKET